MRWTPPLLSAALVVLLTSAGMGGDWPQYRYDAGRTAASPEQLPDTLHLQWSRPLPPPQPAFPDEVRLRYDETYEPVVTGRTMFVPSMVSDSVTALDAESGVQRWVFLAEGPVRFAPVAWQGSVYFVSDDGFLYCVDAENGKLRWKFQGVPPGKTDRKLLGSGRLVSLYPARGGPVLHDGVVFFGAGLWSTYGVGIYALDAKSGRVVWSNTDSNHIAKANMDHGIANFAGLTPQGYLAAVDGKLVVPCGAQLPAFLDLKTGKLGIYCMGWGGRNGLPKGTWFVAGAGRYLSHGGDLYDMARPNDEQFAKSRGKDFKAMLYAGGFTRVRVDATNHKDIGEFSEPVLEPGVLYESGKAVAAYDLTDAPLKPRSASEMAKSQSDDPWPDKWTADFRQRWNLPTDLKLHIRAGQHLYLGGTGIVEAVRIPQAGEKPRIAWHVAIQGTPERMLAADGRLFVVTREGTIYAFGGQEIKPIVQTDPAAPAPPEDEWTKTAADVLRTAKVTDGYALALGVGSGRLVEELVRQSRLQVIAIEPDADRAAAFRTRLHRAGLYGTRASVHVGEPLSYPLAPYLANLVVSEDWARLQAAGGRAFVPAVFHPLRPYGGTACLALPVAQRQALALEIADRHLAGAAVRTAGDWLLLSREGALPGSADWTHAEADAGNTGATPDQFLKSPLDLLWFDTPPRWFRTPGATAVRVAGGRVLIKAGTLKALDVFTGRRLWEADMPPSLGGNDQVVALDDAIYVAGSRECLVLDPASGKKTGQVNLPAELEGAWSNLRVWKDYLVGQCGKSVLCMDRHTGRLLWKHECGRTALSVAVGGGRVFCAELLNQRRGETDNAAAPARALDVGTGKLLWQIPGGSEARYSPEFDVVVMSSGVYHAKDGTLAATYPGATPNPGEKTRPPNQPQPLFVIGSKLLVGNAESYVTCDLLTGKPSGEPMAWTRRGCTIPRASANLVTTRVRGNAACIDLDSRDIIPLWNVRAACSNNLFPADGVLNMPSMTGGCTCNYMPVSQAFVPASAIGKAR